MSFAKIFKDISHQCKKYLVKVAETIGKEGMELSDLKNFGSCLYNKDDKSLILYSKVIYDSNTDLIIIIFYEKTTVDDSDEFGKLSSNPLEYLGKR